ncbi:MAG: nucleoside recognition domain-containing protein [Syntrophomonadaceae bacterium]
MGKHSMNDTISGERPVFITDPLLKIDRYLLNPYTGYPIMMLCFTALFAASFILGKPVSNWLGLGLDKLAFFFENSQLAAALPAALASLVSDGLFRGIGSALAFFPQMLIFFTFYTLINETGYTSRIARLMQTPMNRLHMDANSFSCLLVGYSCNVPSIVSTRDIPRRLDRLLLMLLSTFTPCSARFGVILYISAAFFSPLAATLVMSGLIVLSLLVKGLIALLVKSRYPRVENGKIRLTLPPLHKPNLRAVLRSAIQRTLDFLNKIKNVVIISSVAVWFLSSFPKGAGFEQSYAAMLGRALEPLGALAGLNWQLIMALFLGFFAKETTLSTLGILFHASEGLGNLSTILVSHISPLAGLSFLIMFMFYTPCLATVSTIRRESNSLPFAAFSVGFSLALAYFLGVIFYQLGRLLF